MSEIETKHRGSSFGADLYEIISPYGYVDATFRTPPGWLGIANIFVQPEYRQRGHGQELLHHTLNLARELGAKSIFAALISRESVEAFSRVFGDDSISIRALGDYETEGSMPTSFTSAHFSLELNKFQSNK